jgi:hypothetical protein
MTLDPDASAADQDASRRGSLLRRLVLLLLLVFGSFACIFLASQIAVFGFKPRPLRDVRSGVQVDYGAGERRAAPLVPQVIDAVREDVEFARPEFDTFALTVVPVVVIPTQAPTTVAQITPTPTPRATVTLVATSAVPATPTTRPADTPSATATGAPLPSDTAAATDTPRPTNTPPPPATATATRTAVPSAPTATAAPPPTGTAQPSATPAPATNTPVPATLPPADTHTPSPSATLGPTSPPTATGTPVPTDTAAPTDTPVPTDTPIPTDTPTATATPTATPVPAPVVFSILPNQIVEGSGADPDIDVAITGQNFLGSSSWLGQNIFITIAGVTESLINGRLSPNIPPGIYGLTVRNADGQEGTLPRAFTVLPQYLPDYTFDSSQAFVSTFGLGADPTAGDDDKVQIIFFEVPDGPADTLYVRIYDPDTGGSHDRAGPDGAFGDTSMTYSLRGEGGAYTNPNARLDHPGAAGISSGTLLVEQIVGEDGLLDGRWLPLAVNRGQGELVQGSRLFKLVVQGTSGDDGNGYQVTISTDANSNATVPGARLFAFSWTVALPTPNGAVTVHPYVPPSANRVTQFNFDFDTSPGSAITLSTPQRVIQAVGLSGNGSTASEDYLPFSGELGTTWSAHYGVGNFPPGVNPFTLWFRDGSAAALAIFTTPTLVGPPQP